MPFSIQELKIEILKIFAAASTSGFHKFNLLGRQNQSGALESHLKITFEKKERALAAEAFGQLKKDRLIRSTTADLVDPENWCEITDVGRDALKHGLLDDLDKALSQIDPHLIEIRRGAWSALASSQPDSLRQAAHSGRELIDQVLKEDALDLDIKAQPGFKPDSSSKSGITRPMRLKFIMEKRKGSISKSDLAVAVKACDLVLVLDNKLMAQAHSRTVPAINDVKDALEASEMALKRILL
jgi:hypothetical protein